MTIRIKLILGLCLLLALLAVGIVATFHAWILPEIETIERQNRVVDLSRVEQGIQQELDRIELFMHDWGWWDDTYVYAAKPNREYEQTNLTQAWLQHIKLDLIVIVGPDGRMLASLLSDSGQALAGRFIANNLTAQGARPLLQDGGTGLVLTPVGPLLLASCHILPTDRDGPSHGRLYFGRLVSEALVSELIAKLHLPVRLGLAMGPPSDPLVRELSASATLSEMTLPLLNTDAQALRISLEQKRPFYQRTLASARYSLTLIACVALLAGLAAYLYLSRALVRPIVALKLESERFGQAGRPDGDYFRHLAGRDEIGQLAQAFAEMASRSMDQRSLLERERGEFERDRQRLQYVIDATRVGIWEWQVETGEVVLNARWAEMLGYRLDELRPISIQSWRDLIHPEDLEISNARLQAHLAGRASFYEAEMRLRRKDGRWVWVADRGKVVRWTPNGRPALMSGMHQDISERKTAEAALRASEARARAIIDASPIPKVIVHETGTVHYLNPAFVETFGYTLEDIPTWEDWRRKATPDPAYREQIRQAELARLQREGGELEPLEVRVRCKDGSPRIVMARSTPLGEGEERLNTLYDVTALKQAQAAAEEAARAKSEFLAHMSHEIRTPMNAILGLAELALHQSLSPPAREYLEQAHGAARRLLAILNDILDQSKLEAGRLRLDLIAFAPTALLGRLRELFAPTAVENGLALTIEADPDLPDALLGDALRLQQVLDNLLSNALKFTERGEVRLRLSCVERIGSRARLRWTVSDTGIGMDAPTLERLFQPFSQGDASIARRFGGTGLGLSICRHLAELMGGSLTVESAPGAGSTFTLELTLALAAAPAEAPGIAPGSAASLAGARILVAEDQPLNQRVVGDMLRLLGASVTLAENGGEALEQLAAAPFDAVLMDIQMPEMDGLTATRRIRENPDWAALPVIALTAGVTAEERERITRGGLSDLLPKPVTLDAVSAVLGRWLGRPTGTGATVPATLTPGTSSLCVDDSTLTAFDPQRLALLAEDPVDLADLLRQFAETTRDDPSTITVALAEGEPRTAAQHLHRLKGVAANLGATGILAAAQDLERALHADADPARALAALRQVHAALLAHIDSLQVPATHTGDAGHDGQVLDGLHLLVADDSPMNLEVTRRLLAREGARATLCTSGDAVLEALRDSAEAYDGVLMDLQMPGMDGCETAIQIRRWPRLAHLPIIALTAGVTATEQQRAKLAGIDAFLGKPIDPTRLVRVLRRHIESPEGWLSPVASAPSAPPAGPTQAGEAWPEIVGIDSEEAAISLAGDLAFFRELLGPFLDDNAQVVQEIRGRLELGDPVPAAKLVHKLCGQAGNLGARPLAEASGALEDALNGAGADLEARLFAFETAHAQLFDAARRWLNNQSERSQDQRHNEI